MVRVSRRRWTIAAASAVAGVLLAGPGVALAVEGTPLERPGRLTPNQLFGGRSLTLREAMAACGPAAAVAFANATGRPISLDRAVAVARQIGWTPEYGMTGPYGEVSLLSRLGIPSIIEVGTDAAKIVREVQAGRPVIIRTSGNGRNIPGHYFVAERYDVASGRFDLAQSALVLRSAAGRRWYSLREMTALGAGVPTHTIYLAGGVSRPSTTPATAARSAASTVGAMSMPQGRAIGTHVVQTGGPGARLRAAPDILAAVVGGIPNGSRVSVVGPAAPGSGRIWRKLAVAGGASAWIDANLLVP
jgi:hypothetical protein